MDEREGRAVLSAVLAGYRAWPYARLSGMVGRVETAEVAGDSGVAYQVEVQFLWDDRPGGRVRVHGAIDDGGLRALVPLCDAFLKAPDRGGPEP
jgi:hypothetical protein